MLIFKQTTTEVNHKNIINNEINKLLYEFKFKLLKIELRSKFQ